MLSLIAVMPSIYCKHQVPLCPGVCCSACCLYQGGNPSVVMAGTVKSLELSDAFLKYLHSSLFHSSCCCRPFLDISPTSSAVTATASIQFQRSLSTSVTASERCTCFSIGCSARHRNQVGALVIHLRPPVLLLSAAEALQSLYLWHIFSAATAPASVAVPADSTKFKDPVVTYRHLSDASRAAIALLRPVAILSLQFLS